ncbi:IclR family transcriptional regulator [Pimelobacter simplex]|uniref:IclR family transcriptional regulator n=1 Tax=Nocardioides simplex TaxID=2045 RepID=UPI0019337FA1|nr:IclR family transcriptional regulator [Pimelobacter simplex]
MNAGGTAVVEAVRVGARETAPANTLEPSDRGDGDPVTSVAKALRLLDAFRQGGGRVGVTELARRASLPKSTAFRLLAHLERSGYVERVGTDYRLGWRLFELGNQVQVCAPHGLRQIATPYLSEVYASTGHVTQLAVLDGVDVVYLEKIHGRRAVRTPTAVGTRMPAACVALGKAILAFSEPGVVRVVLDAGLERRTPYSFAEPGQFARELHRIRTNGIALDREEAALGLACVAAPILVGGRPIAAISVSMPATRFDAGAVAARVRQAAKQIADEYVAQAASRR